MTADDNPDVTAFVTRTTEASGVTERLEDPATIEQIAQILRGAPDSGAQARHRARAT